jgi:putative hydrolases of HD superfamily
MDKLLAFAIQANSLKRHKRAGWLNYKVKDSESVADHYYEVALLATVLAKRLKVDEQKFMKMAMVHDLPEMMTGDLIKERGDRIIRSSSDRIEKESPIIKKILLDLPGGDEYYSLWHEFESQESREAKLLKQIDRLEMAIQAIEYEKENPGMRLDEFLVNSEMHIKEPELVKLFKQLMETRPAATKLKK